jgi:hypothetical protein
LSSVSSKITQQLKAYSWTTDYLSEDPAMGSELYDAVKRATDQLTKAPADEIRDLALNKQKLLMLRNLSHAIEDLATLADVKL